MKICLLFLLLFSMNSNAQAVSLPPSVSGIDEVVASFRDTLIKKIEELGKNFITINKNNVLIYTSSNDLKCNGFLTVKGQAISSVMYSHKVIGNQLVEKITYTGCNQLVSLVEDIITTGKDLKAPSFFDVIKGRRSFDLRDNEQKRVYRVTNSDNEELVSMVIEKNGHDKKMAEFFIVGNKFVTMSYEFQPTFTRLTLLYPGYAGKYVRKFSTWEFSARYDPFTNSVVSRKNESGSVDSAFFDTRGARFSQADFLSRTESFLFSGPLARIRSFFDYHNYYFPTTQVVQTSGQNERLKEELRLAFNRLQNNVELNLVKKQIQDYIEAAEKGQLTDSRPKE